MKLRAKILSYTLPLILIPFLLTAFAVYYFIIRVNQIQIQEENKQSLSEALVSIGRDVDSVKKDIELLANVPAIVNRLTHTSKDTGTDVLGKREKSARGVLELFFDQNPYYVGLSLVDRQGKEIIKLSKFSNEPKLQILSGENYFRRALMIGNVQVPARKLENGHYATIFAKRIVNKEFIGMIVLTLDARAFERSMRPLLKRKLSTFLFDDRGVVMASIFGFDVDKNLITNIDLKNEALDLLSKSSFELSRREISSEGSVVLFSVLPSESFSRFLTYESPEGANWFLGVFEQPSASSIPITVQLSFFSILFLALGAVLLVAAKASRRITIPLEQVSKATDKIALGESDLDLNIKTGDEVEDLANAVTKMNRDLKDYQKQLVQSAKLATMGEMTSEISHEIQNRISGISLWLQHLDSEIGADDPKKEYLDEMKQGLSGFMEMLASLKDYYKTPILNLQAIDLNQLVDNSLQFVEEKIGEKRVDVALNLADSLPKIKGDEEKLTSVILNLLLNAVESLDINGKIKIETDVDSRNENVVLTISDRGSGISEGDLSRVFYPFYSTKSGGSGLGLAIASNIVSAHKGRIEVESEMGKGTTFKVVLRIKRAEELPANYANEHE